MNGIETAAVAVARNLYDSAREDMAHVKDIMSGKAKANGLYTVKRLEEIHSAIIAANRIELDNLMARYREDG